MNSSCDMIGQHIWPDETSAALKTRLVFIWNKLRIEKPTSILDIGCGTGEHLTSYLSTLFPGVEILGVDTDKASIEQARNKYRHLKNLTFSTSLPPNCVFDAIIASEVLEHVDNPYQFMLSLRTSLKDNGLLIITVPNGYGCSEIMGMIIVLLNLSGVLPTLRKVKNFMIKKPKERVLSSTDTLAVSPHVNFFGFRKLRTIFVQCGFESQGYQGRMVLHNFVCSMVIDRNKTLAKWNARLGSVFSQSFVSDWMFALKKIPCPSVNGGLIYRRNIYERLRRYLNHVWHGLPV